MLKRRNLRVMEVEGSAEGHRARKRAKPGFEPKALYRSSKVKHHERVAAQPLLGRKWPLFGKDFDKFLH